MIQSNGDPKESSPLLFIDFFEGIFSLIDWGSLKTPTLGFFAKLPQSMPSISQNIGYFRFSPLSKTIAYVDQ